MNNTFIALLQRDFLEGKGGYFWAPLVALGLALFFVLFPLLGITDGARVMVGGADSIQLQEFFQKIENEDPAEVRAAATLALSSLASIVWIPLPFVIFFTLINQLYDDRKDRSILFWKSMPVSDTQEVLAKFVMPVFIAPLIYLAIAFVGALIFAFLFSIVSLFLGGPILALWPIFSLIQGAFHVIVTLFIWLLWAAPILAWLMLASAYAGRAPFLFAIAPPAMVIALEGIIFETTNFARWIAIRLGGWADFAPSINDSHINGPRELFALGSQWIGGAVGYSLSELGFWLGIALAAAFLFGAIELRKRAL